MLRCRVTATSPLAAARPVRDENAKTRTYFLESIGKIEGKGALPCRLRGRTNFDALPPARSAFIQTKAQKMRGDPLGPFLGFNVEFGNLAEETARIDCHTLVERH